MLVPITIIFLYETGPMFSKVIYLVSTVGGLYQGISSYSAVQVRMPCQQDKPEYIFPGSHCPENVTNSHVSTYFRQSLVYIHLDSRVLC